MTFDGWTKEKVDEKFADQDMGKELLSKINAKIRKANSDRCLTALCCSPKRGKDGLHFWINTGRMTNIDGWKTKEEIDKFLKGDGKIADTAKW